MGTKEYEKSITYKYYWESCNNIENFDSYLTQIKEVYKLKPENVLEIGCGNKLFSTHLQNIGIDTYTMDINEKLNPNFLCDISQELHPTFRHGSFKHAFDCVCAFEILEHMPKDKVETALFNLSHFSNKYVVISLPFRQKRLNVLTNLLHFKTFNVWLPFKFKNGASHYWELDFGNLTNFIGMLATHFSKVEYKFPIYNKRHIFFICEKR